MIWNHAATIIMSLLYGAGSFSLAMEICAHSGGDTDCNCGNVGAILGALYGIEGIDYKRWIEAINDDILCSSAVPFLNETSVTQLTAHILKSHAAIFDKALPSYLSEASADGRYTFTFRYSYQNFRAGMWRDGKRCYGCNRYHSLYMAENEVITPSGSPFALKFWADHALSGDDYRIYKWFNNGFFDDHMYAPSSGTQVFPGQTVSVNIFTYENTCEMVAWLWVYSSENDRSYVSEQKIALTENKWTTLSLTIPSEADVHYNCVNVQIVPLKNSTMNPDGFDGLAVYLDDLKISGKPKYSVDFTAYHPGIELRYGYPQLKNFSVDIGTVSANHLTDVRGKNVGYLRFMPETGTPSYDYPSNSLTQSLLLTKKMTFALTGPMSDHYEAWSDVSILPFEEGSEGVFDRGEKAAALMLILAKGMTIHYGVGFYKGQAVIVKGRAMPGEYDILSSKPYAYSLINRYRFHVKVQDSIITFRLLYLSGTEQRLEMELIYRMGESSAGCIGFASLENGICVYRYGID